MGNKKIFPLIPFTINDTTTKFSITAETNIQDDTFKVAFNLQGPIQLLEESGPKTYQRKDFLWHHTCFEVFWGPRAETAYYEINLARNGDWNFYSFTDFRAGMKTESQIQSLETMLKEEDEKIKLSVHLPNIDFVRLNLKSGLDIGIAAILQPKFGPLSYWSIRHPLDKPDFHNREHSWAELC